MSENYDKLTCGNCGHDGGLRQAVEKAALEKKLAAALNVSDDTRQLRAWVAGISSVCIAIILAIAAWRIVPVLVDSPTSAKSRHVAEMYEKCVQSAQTLERSAQPRTVEDCNDTFEIFLKTIEPKLE